MSEFAKTHYIAIDGPDGVGKTTLIKALVDYFNTSTSYRAIRLTPSNNAYGQWIKQGLNDPALKDTIPPELELTLQSSTLEYFDKVEIPKQVALARRNKPNKSLIVFLDRWVDSTIIYQGYLKQPGNIAPPAKMYHPNHQADLQIVLDTSDTVLDERLFSQKTGLDRYETPLVQQVVRQGYRRLDTGSGPYPYDEKRHRLFLEGSLEENKCALISFIVTRLK